MAENIKKQSSNIAVLLEEWYDPYGFHSVSDAETLIDALVQHVLALEKVHGDESLSLV